MANKLDYSSPEPPSPRVSILAIFTTALGLATLPCFARMWIHLPSVAPRPLLLILPPVFGLLLGVLAAIRIHISSGRLRGMPWAVCGIVFSFAALAFHLLIYLMFAGAKFGPAD